MSTQKTRRELLRGAAYTGIGLWVADKAEALRGKSPGDIVNFACIGIDGKGSSDTAEANRLGRVVAICDVDETKLNKAGQLYPSAKKYTDYRKMLEEMDMDIDAVTVSTPDHSHAPAAAMAMHMGKHTFCQKPLTHSIYEARKLGEIAKSKKVYTQMGNQGTAGSSLREMAAKIRAGAIGTVKEVHVWTNRPIWPQGGARPEPTPVPSDLHWDLWLGPAPKRPYGPGYHTFAWRGWWDFGTGALGDMACHTVNMPYMALDLKNPTSVEAQSGGHNKDSYPKWSSIKYEFPRYKGRPALTMYWYDGGKMLPLDLVEGVKPSDSGSLIVGDKGKVYTPGDYGGGGRIIGGTEVGTVHFPESPGHFQELIRAIKEGIPAMSNFPDYAGPLTETILLGNLAVWAGKKIEWDAKGMRAKNAPEVSHIIRPTYRAGYSL